MKFSSSISDPFGTNITFVILAAIFVISCQRGNRTQLSGDVIKNPVVLNADTKTRKVRLLPYWVPSSQFAGYYVGIEKGIFKKHGIDLEIIPYDSQVSPDSLLRERKIDFAPLWLVNAIEIREKGVDIVNIAQFSTRSSLMLISKKSSGINKIEDINGKKAGIWLGFEMQPKALFKKSKLDVKIIPIGSTNSLFLLGGVDVTNANWFDEYH